MDYKKSLNLPRTKFPMKANLSKREPEQLKKWEENRLHDQIRNSSKGREPFILHDGPPYANGNIGYLPFREAYHEGGYEVETAYKFYNNFLVSAGSYELVREQAIFMLDDMLREEH